MKIDCAVHVVSIEDRDSPHFDITLRNGRRSVRLEVDDDGSSRLTYSSGLELSLPLAEGNPDITRIAEALETLFD